MPTPPRPTPRESTEAMVRNIARELAEIHWAIGRCRGDVAAEPRLTGTWMAHLLICSKELLHNLLIDTASRPRRIELRNHVPPKETDCAHREEQP